MPQTTLSDTAARMAQSTRGETLPWIDAQGRVIEAYATAFGECLSPDESYLEESGVVVARLVWESLSEREKNMGRALSPAPRRLAEWLLQGTSITGLDPDLAPWRDSQRQTRLAVLLAQGWSEEHERDRQATLWAQGSPEQENGLSAVLLGSLLPARRTGFPGRGLVGRLSFSAVANAPYLAAAALGGPILNAHSVAASLPWGVGAIAIAAMGFALSFFARNHLRMDKEGAPLLWPVARAFLPLAKGKAIEKGQQSAAAHWARCGALSKINYLSAITPAGFDRLTWFPLAARLSQQKRFGGLPQDTPLEDQEIARLAATVSLPSLLALEESQSLKQILTQAAVLKSPSGSEVLQPAAPRRKARSL